jgi:molybdopterin converting factor small subunit
VTVRVLAFARLRELLGFGERALDIDDGATLEDVWTRLAHGANGLDAMRASTRFARNGALAGGTTAVHEGDEIALLPPVGGG